LHSQHEHDLEQLVGLKKQLEKKLADAYEELDEQRQIVGQWKKKTQKVSNEMSDLRMLLEEQNNRNILLEKRQKKFDIDCQTLQDAAKQEKMAKEQLLREKDVILAEKFHLEQKLAVNISKVKNLKRDQLYYLFQETNLELEFKENHLKNLKEEFEETFSSEGELNELKKRTVNLNRLCKDQEAEIEELASSLEVISI
jgi:myosin XVIII